MGFPGGSVVKTMPANAKKHSFNPWSGKIPHAAEQKSTCTTTVEPVLWSLGTTTTESICHNYQSLHTLQPVLRNKKSHLNEKPTQCN